VPRGLVLLLVYTAFLPIAWRLRPAARERTVWSLTAVVCAVPLLWPHTFVVYFPVLVAAVATAWSSSLARRRAAGSASTRGPQTRSTRIALPWWSDAALVACCGAAILFFEAANLDHLPPWIQLALLLPPLLSPLLLAFYLTPRRIAQSSPGADLA
jgi:hypothetical protein